MDLMRWTLMLLVMLSACRSSSGPAPAPARLDARASGGGLARCEAFADGVAAGTVVDQRINEASGLAASRRNPGVLWVHNDSGDRARVFALSEAGAVLAVVDLPGVTAIDFEDIAVGREPGGESFLYLADIGDNRRWRGEVQVYRAPEPEVRRAAGGPTQGTLAGVTTLRWSYPDGPHNAEVLLSDPDTGDLYVVTKDKGGVSQVFKAPHPHRDGAPVRLEEVGRIIFDPNADKSLRLATGGDIAPDGRSVLVRTYEHALMWTRAVGQTLAAALDGAPCVAPIKPEQQGESLGFAADGGAYFTVSEGTGQTLWRFARR